MGIVTNALSEVLRKSLDLKAWLYFGVLWFIESIALLLLLVPFAVVLAVFLFSSGFFDNTSSAFDILSSLMPFFVVLGLIGVIVFFGLFVFFEGMELHFSREFLSGKKRSLTKALSLAFQRAKQRFWVMFGTKIIISLIMLAILGVLFAVFVLPVLFHFLPLIEASSTNYSALIGSFFSMFLYVLVVVLVLVVALFLLNPFFVLGLQVSLFEDKGIIESVKRTIRLGKSNYFLNLSFLFLFGLVIALIYCFISVIEMFPYLLIGFLVIGSASNVGLMLFIILWSLVFFIVRLLYIFWTGVVQPFFMAKIYELNIVEEKGH